MAVYSVQCNTAAHVFGLRWLFRLKEALTAARLHMALGRGVLFGTQEKRTAEQNSVKPSAHTLQHKGKMLCK